jgi:hypothetical protein
MPTKPPGKFFEAIKPIYLWTCATRRYSVSFYSSALAEVAGKARKNSLGAGSLEGAGELFEQVAFRLRPQL